MDEKKLAQLDANDDEQSLSRCFLGDGKTVITRFQDFTTGTSSSSSSSSSSLTFRSGEFVPGQVIDDKFEILALLGRGGMGVVYRARHRLLNKEVALKTFVCGNVDQESWQRFQLEARAIARLQSANIVKIFDFGVWGENSPYYSMELLKGFSLAERLEQQTFLRPSETLAIFEDVVSALAYAAGKGIIHRDIKPANIFLSQEEKAVVKLVDFGVAKLLGDAGSEQQSLTAAGLIFGSPLYMSPEQVSGGRVDFRSDIYSCGCSIFECLTGEPPFRGANSFVTMQMHVMNVPPSLPARFLKGPGSMRLRDLLKKMLAKRPEERFQSFEELAAEISTLRILAAELDAGTAGDGITVSAVSQVAPSLGSANAAGSVAGGKSAFSKDGRGKSNFSDSAENQDGVSQVSKNFGREKTHLLIAALGLVAILILCSLMLFHRPDRPNTKDEVIIGASTSEKRTEPGASVAINWDRIQPYLIRQANGQRVFSFPTELGKLSYCEPWPKVKRARAMGSVSIPATSGLHLECDEIIGVSPEYLRGFAPNDLNGIKCVFEKKSGNRQLQEIVRLKGLKSLSLQDFVLDSTSIDLLNQLEFLDSLELRYGTCDCRDLVRLKRLDKLNYLYLSGGHNVSSIVDALALKSKSPMTALSLINCDLTDVDIEKLPANLSIWNLNVSDNHLTDRSLAALSKWKSLRQLRIPTNNVSFEGLKRMKQLKSLCFSSGKDGASIVPELKKVLLGCHNIKVETPLSEESL